jgi:hypothetical protein
MNINTYNLPPQVILPNESPVFEPYVAPKSILVNEVIELPKDLGDIPSVDIVVDLPKSNPLSTFNYIPARADYNIYTSTVVAGMTGGVYEPAKTIEVNSAVQINESVLPNSPEVFTSYIPPKSIEILSGADRLQEVDNLESVEIVVDLPKSNPLSTFNFIPARADYNVYTTTVVAGMEGDDYTPAKTIEVRSGINVGVDLPNELPVFEPYIAPKSIDIVSGAGRLQEVDDLESVDIVVDLPKSNPLSTYSYTPVRSDFVMPTTVMAGLTGGVYEVPKSVSVNSGVQLARELVIPQTQLDAVSQPGIIGIQPNITYRGNTPIFALASDLGNWSSYPATQTVDMAGFGMTGLGNVVMNNSTISGVTGITMSPSGNLNMNTGRIVGVNELVMNNGDIRAVSYIEIDGQILTADAEDLLLNGHPIATINTLPNIDEWALYPAIGNVVMNAEGISGQPFGVTGSKFYGFSDGTNLGVSGGYMSYNGSGYGFSDGSKLGVTGNALVFNGSTLATTTNVTNWANNPAVGNVVMNNHGVSGASYYGFTGGNTLTASANTLYLDGSAIGGAGYTGASQWANFPAVADVNANSQSIRNVANIVYGTETPFISGQITGLNDLYMSYVTAALGQTSITNVNTVAWWNPNNPGVPGYYATIVSKRGQADFLTYLLTNTPLQVFDALWIGNGANAGQGFADKLKPSNVTFGGITHTILKINENDVAWCWANSPALTNVNMNNYGLGNVSEVQFNNATDTTKQAGMAININGQLVYRNLVGGQPDYLSGIILPNTCWSLDKALQDVDIANYKVKNVNSIVMTPNGPALGGGSGAGNYTLSTDISGDLLWNGNVISGATGTIEDWAKYPAVSNVVIPADYSLSINAENTLVSYKTTVLNTNIQHGVEGNVDSPDFISFPTTFQVGNTAFPAREITMTAGAEGFGINSDTEINIDATALVEIHSAGVVTIESVTDFNLTASITTFEIGEWNVVSAATTLETGAVSWTCGTVFDLNAPAINFFGGVVNVGAAGMIIEGGGLGIAAGGVSVTAGGISVAGGGILMNGGSLVVGTSSGRTELQSGCTIIGTLDAPTITGVNAFAGNGGSGCALTNISSINGTPFGKLEAGQQTYSYDDVITNVNLGTTATKVYESPSFTWRFTSTPMMSILINGFNSVANTQSVGFFLYIQVGATLYKFNSINLNTPAVSTPVSFQGSTYINAGWNELFQTNFSEGTSYTIQLYASVNTGTVVYNELQLAMAMVSSITLS